MGPLGISDLDIQPIPPKKANGFKDIKLYFQFCMEAVLAGVEGKPCARAWTGILALPLAASVTLGKLPDLLVPPFSHL